MKKTEKQKEQNRKYNNKNAEKIRTDMKKRYWKNKGYDSKYINDMCEKHGEKAFDIIKALKHEERIKEQHSKTEKRLNLLKSVSVH
jgi:hypothetical protein